MPKPVLQAMVLADHIYRDAETGKFLIIGTFGNIMALPPAPAKSAPAEDDQITKHDNETDGGDEGMLAREVRQVGSPYLYLALTGLHGPLTLRLRYVDLSDFHVLFEGRLDVTSSDPLALAEFSVPLPPLPIRLPVKPGQYSLDVLYDGEILGTWRVGVKMLREPSEERE